MMDTLITEVISTPPLTLATSALSGLRDLSEQAGAAQGWITVLALAGIVAVGLALWTLGGRFVRPSVVLVASASGGYAGYALGHFIDPGVGPWIGMAFGVAAGAMLGYALFRFASAALLAAFLAIAAPTGAAVALDYDLADRAQAFVDAVRDATKADNDTPTAGRDDTLFAPRSLTDNTPSTGTRDDADDESVARGVLARAGAWITGFLADAAEGGEEIWDDLDPREQNTLLLASVIGAIAGLLIGGIFPTVAMAVITSGLGAALLLGAGSHLGVALRPEWADKMPGSPIAWAAIWLSLAFLGVLIQAGPRRRRRKPEPAAAEGA